MDSDFPPPSAPDLNEILDAAALTEVAAELRARSARCRARDTNTEGIPMMLTVEDAAGGAPVGGGSPLENAVAVLMAAWTLHVQENAEPSAADLATALEVLAERELGLWLPPVSESPSGGPEVPAGGEAGS